MTTTPPTPESDLENLRRLVAGLSRDSLPPETAAALGEIEEGLSALDARLAASEQRARLTALYQVSQSFGSSLNLTEVLNQAMDAVIALTGAERGFLMLYDPAADTLDLQVGRNIEQRTLESKSMEISRSVVRSVLEQESGILTTNAQEDPRFYAQDSVIGFALRSIMCTPLQSRGKTLGVIYVDNRMRAGSFEEHDLNLLDTFAAQAAIGIENARLYTRTDQSLAERVSELETLSQIDRELNAQLELEHVLDVIRRRASESTGAAVDILLESAEPGSYTWAAGPEAGREFHAGDGPETDALESGEPAFAETGPDAGSAVEQVSPDPGRGARTPREPRSAEPAVGEQTPETPEPPGGGGESESDAQPSAESGGGALTVFPLILGGRATGLLRLRTPKPLAEEQQAFIQRLAARSSVAIANARLYQAVQEANTAKSKFVSVVSHELRLPMTSIKGYTDLILQGTTGEISDMQRGFLEIVRKSVDRMGILVSDLQDISRIETGRLKLAPAAVDLMPYLQQVTVDLQPKIDQKAQTLHLDVPPDLPQVRADPNRLIQVLTNLIGNAWKYTPEEGMIKISAVQADGCVRISVLDTGIGIAPEDQEQLFTQFFRSEDARVRDQPGWGLGLNVTRNLVHLMDGEIGVESELDRGSVFWFTLPETPP